MYFVKVSKFQKSIALDTGIIQLDQIECDLCNLMGCDSDSHIRIRISSVRHHNFNTSILE